MTPDVSTTWVDEDPLPEGRVMGNWIFLPDGRLVLINGIGKGTAGYGSSFVISPRPLFLVLTSVACGSQETRRGPSGSRSETTPSTRMFLILDRPSHFLP